MDIPHGKGKIKAAATALLRHVQRGRLSERDRADLTACTKLRRKPTAVHWTTIRNCFERLEGIAA